GKNQYWFYCVLFFSYPPAEKKKKIYLPVTAPATNGDMSRPERDFFIVIRCRDCIQGWNIMITGAIPICPMRQSQLYPRYGGMCGGSAGKYQHHREAWRQVVLFKTAGRLYILLLQLRSGRTERAETR